MVDGVGACPGRKGWRLRRMIPSASGAVLATPTAKSAQPATRRRGAGTRSPSSRANPPPSMTRVPASSDSNGREMVVSRILASLID
jgi:hypothetical protein